MKKTVFTGVGTALITPFDKNEQVDFEKMGNIGGWKEYQDVTNLRYENGALRGNSTARDPGVWIEGLNIIIFPLSPNAMQSQSKFQEGILQKYIH